MNTFESIIDYENGELDDDETIALFQGLIDTGVVWDLQGSYGRVATRLINDGVCHQATGEQAE